MVTKGVANANNVKKNIVRQYCEDSPSYSYLQWHNALTLNTAIEILMIR